MYKRNPYIEIILLILFIITNLIIQNSVIQLVILYLQLKLNSKLSKKIKISLMIISIVNIMNGFFISLMKIINIVIYVYSIAKKYNKKDIIQYYIYITKKNPQELWIKSLYFSEYFKNNLYKIKYLTKELGYKKKIGLYKYNITISLKNTKTDLDSLIHLLEKRHFYNQYKNISIIEIDKNDINTLLICVIILIISILIWRSKYAIFI